MIRNTLLAFLLGSFSLLVSAGTYEPTDPKVYMEPSDVMCSGLRDYPKGIHLTIPRYTTVGTLEEGMQYLYPEGKVAVYVFEFTGDGGASHIAFRATRIDLLDFKTSEHEGKCTVRRWHPMPKQH
jgi:hypothetical protein